MKKLLLGSFIYFTFFLPDIAFACATCFGEKFFDSDFGSEVSKSLFENVDEVSAITIREEIEYSIKTYEPRVTLLSVDSIPNYDNNEFNVVVTYQILGADSPPQELEFVLLPAR